MNEEPTTPDVDELATMQPKNTVTTSLGRANGFQRMTVAIEVSCAEPTHNARTEMVNLLRSLALDIETGLA